MTKLERARIFLKEAAWPGLRVVALGALAVGAYASTIAGTVFNVTGTFDDGESLSGTVIIDTIGSAGILTEDLTADPIPVSYIFDSGLSSGSGFQQVGSGSGFYYYEAIFDGTAGSTLTLDFDTAGLDTFAGYAGGPLCSDADTTGCGGAESSFADPSFLSVGQVSKVTPEPSTVLLSIAGGAATVAVLRRRKRSA